MSELELKRKRQYPSIFEMDREFDENLREDLERQRRERALRDLLNSNESPEVIGAKAVIAGLISYYQYEEIFYANEYKRRGPIVSLFLPKEEEKTTKRHNRVVLER